MARRAGQLASETSAPRFWDYKQTVNPLYQSRYDPSQTSAPDPFLGPSDGFKASYMSVPPFPASSSRPAPPFSASYPIFSSGTWSSPVLLWMPQKLGPSCTRTVHIRSPLLEPCLVSVLLLTCSKAKMGQFFITHGPESLAHECC